MNRLSFLLAVLSAVLLTADRSNCQAMSATDTVILIKPEEMRVVPMKTFLERKLAAETEEEKVTEERVALPEVEERKKEERKFEIEEKRRRENVTLSFEEMFKHGYVAIGVIKLIFDNTTEPFTLFYDGLNNRSRVDLGPKGLVRSLQLPNSNRMYRIEFPSRETSTKRAVCIEMRGTHDKPIKVINAVPDFDRFERVGEDKIGNLKVDRLKLELTDEKRSTKHTFFLFTEPETKKPIRLEVFARSTKSNKVVDHYQVDYRYFLPTRLSDDVFVKPVEIECRSITGLSEVEEHETKKERRLERFEVDKERLHMNPIASLVDPDQRLAYEHEIDSLFEGFRRRYNKTYASDEEEFEVRRAAFCHNYRFINLINRAGLSYRLRINFLADRTNDELRKMLGVHGVGKVTSSEHGVAFDSKVHNIRGIDRLPDSIDWRLLGAVTPVMNQGECGSDWAIAATSVIESALYLRSNRLVNLSPQELLDCGHETGNNECNFGTPWQAYEYVLKNGLASEIAYGPYAHRKKECRHDAPVSAKIKRWVLVGNDEHELKHAVAMNGPVAVMLDAGHKSFFFYANGIYREPNCRTKPNEVNHAALVVGYGQLNGVDYFLLQNSFSQHWGLNGYMLIEAKGNRCGILSAPTFVDM